MESSSSGRVKTPSPKPPYLHRFGSASARSLARWDWMAMVGAWPGLLPVPDCCRFVRAAGAGQGARSARVAAPQAPLPRPRREPVMGGRGRGALLVRVRVQRSGPAAFLCGVTSRGGRGAGPGAASLTWVRGAWRCPGDMMIDWVSPPAGMRPLSLIRPSAWPPLRLGRRRLTAARRELAAVVPIGLSVAAVCPAGPARSRAGDRWHGGGSQAAASASSPGSVRMWQACRMILRASDSAARLPPLFSLTWAW